VELADTRDLKSLAMSMPVRTRPRVPKYMDINKEPDPFDRYHQKMEIERRIQAAKVAIGPSMVPPKKYFMDINKLRKVVGFNFEAWCTMGRPVDRLVLIHKVQPIMLSKKIIEVIDVGEKYIFLRTDDSPLIQINRSTNTAPNTDFVLFFLPE
jgi:hypothetical protein